MRTRFVPLLLLLLTVAALPGVAHADDVYLANGRKFEGVVAESTDSEVRIQIQGGVLVLPKSQVLRVESGDSNLAEYLRRREALKRGQAQATGWLELARWAKARQMDQAARESALTAAALDPRLEGLAGVLRGYGYVLDEELDRWVTYADSMRRRGFVQSGGEWIGREEYQARLRAHEEQEARDRAAREERSRAAREDRLAALTELAIARDLAQSPQPPAPGPYTPWGASVIMIPGYVTIPPVLPPGGGVDPDPGPAPAPPSPMPRNGSSNFRRVPGSLIPGWLYSPGN
jgi:hypothetical protein